MVAQLRQTIREGGTLWTTVGRVLKAEWRTLLLLFLLGWVSYYLTLLVTGFVAPRWSWAVIPLMAAGTLVQMLVTLTAYRRCIRAAETALGVPQLAYLSFRELVARLLVPFVAAYSVFGFFKDFARDGFYAAESLVGTFSGGALFANVNPLESPVTLVIVVVAFGSLWLAARLINRVSDRRDSMPLGLLSAFVAGCSTFLVLFSAFRLQQAASMWLQGRAFVGWWAGVLAWLGSLVHIDLPTMAEAAWAWLRGSIWPVFWYALSQPIIWLGVIALVGGMQFLDVDTVWARLRGTRGLRISEGGVADVAGRQVVKRASKVIPLLHLVTVILKAGVPFLGAFVLTFTLVDRAAAWLSMLVDKAIGPLPTQYVMLLLPPGRLVDQVVKPLVTAVLLAVAYVRLRRDDNSLAFNRPRQPGWNAAIVGVLCIALATLISLPQVGSADRVYRLRDGQAQTIMGVKVVVDDLRVGSALVGYAGFTNFEQPLPSEGVFVAVRVSVSGYKSSNISVSAVVGDVEYPTWDNLLGINAPPGFSVTTDLVFEVPPDALPGLVIAVTPVQPLSTTLGKGLFALPDDVVVDDVITVDCHQIPGVP